MDSPYARAFLTDAERYVGRAIERPPLTAEDEIGPLSQQILRQMAALSLSPREKMAWLLREARLKRDKARSAWELARAAGGSGLTTAGLAMEAGEAARASALIAEACASAAAASADFLDETSFASFREALISISSEAKRMAEFDVYDGAYVCACALCRMYAWTSAQKE